jgi:hypothetical protein
MPSNFIVNRSKNFNDLLFALDNSNVKYNFKKILLEIKPNKIFIQNLRNSVLEYVRKNINSYYNLNINKINDISKFRELILRLPNITPNGVINPRIQTHKEYQKIIRLIKIMISKYKFNEIYDLYEYPDVRLMRSNKFGYNSQRNYSSSIIHSDKWAGHPSDAKVAIFINGDPENTIYFFKPKITDKNFFSKQNNYKQSIKKYGYSFIKKQNKNMITLFDQSCLHKTENKNKDLRLSLDFGLILKKNKFKKFEKRYQNKFISIKKNPPNSVRNLISIKTICYE